MLRNKVTFGLKNVHYAVIHENDGEVSFDVPIHIPGGVELTLTPRGELFEFWADDLLYHASHNNQGYDGEITIANIPQHFFINVLGEELDEQDGVLTEFVNVETNRFALLFEFDGDVKAVRHVLYNCTANRPTIASSTKTDTVEPDTMSFSFTSSPIVIGNRLLIKTKTTEETAKSIYDSWYEQVYIKSDRPAQLYAADFVGVEWE